MNLASLNLNHLVSLEALLKERHVGDAAERMGVTQSAMSHTLRALREMLGDPLLVRVGNEMQLTPYAEQAQVKLQRGLADLDAVVSGRAAFDPSRVKGRFTLASHDGTAAPLTLFIHQKLRDVAPDAGLRIMPIDTRTLESQLESGDVDVAVIPPFVAHDGMTVIDPGSVGVSVVCRRDHPTIKKRLSLKKFVETPHAMVSMTGEGGSVIDEMLEKRGKKRTVAVVTPYILSLAEVLSQSDLLAAVPTPLADYLCAQWPLKKCPFPLGKPRAGLLICTHPRFEADPQNIFFRNLVKDAVESMSEDIESYRS